MSFIAKAAAIKKGDVVAMKSPLYRGLKIEISQLKEDSAEFEGPKFYGEGIYYHLTPWLAAGWIGATGIIVKYVPSKTLRLLKYDSPQERKDHLKNLPDNIDGVWLANPHQEAGPQVILRKPIKPSKYWNYTSVETNWEAAKQLDPKKLRKVPS